MQDKTSGGAIFGLVMICLFIWLLFGQHGTDYSKPWWDGTSIQRICKVPYYSNDECYSLLVASDGDSVLSVTFNNGGYINFDESECTKPAEGQGISRMCDLYTDGQRTWQVILPE